MQLLPWSMREFLTFLRGPSAISRWTWILTAPFTFLLTLLMRYPGMRLTPAWVLVSAGAQLVTIPTMWLARRFLARADSALATMFAFAAIGAVRAPLVDVWCRLFGYAASRVAVWSLAQALVAVAACTAIAVMVGEFRANAAVTARLAAAQRDLALGASSSENELQRLRDFLDARVLQPIRTAVAEMTSSPALTAGQAASQLRMLSETAVRESSHVLIEGGAELRRPMQAERAESRALRLRHVAANASALAPLSTAAVFAAIMFGPQLAVTSISEATVATTVTFACNLVGCIAIWRLDNARRELSHRLAILVGAYFVVGAAASATTVMIADALGLNTAHGLATATAFPAMTSAFMLIASARKEQERLERELARSVTALAQSSTALVSTEYRFRRHIAHVLHAQVQGDILAIAAQLVARAETIDVADVFEQLFIVRDSLERMLSWDPDAEVVRYSETLTDFVAQWRSAMPVSLDIQAEAAFWLDARPAVADRLVDACAEALVNVLRHSTRPEANVEVRLSGSGVGLIVQSPGRLASRSDPGLGTSEFNRLCDWWRITEERATVQFSAGFE